MTEHRISGKNVLIAGGAKNLGGMVARDLADHGAKAITIHYNSDATRSDADDTVAAISAAGVDAHAFQADLTSATAVAQLFDDATAAMGSIDIAINTAGMVIKKPVAEVTEDDFDRIFAINAKTVLLHPTSRQPPL